MLPAPTKAMRLWSNAEVLKERVALEKKYDEAIAEVKSKFKSKEIDSLLDDFVISRYDGGFDKLQQIVGKYQHSKLDVLARRLNRLANEKKALDYLNERVAHMKPRGVAIYQDNVMETAASLGGFVMKLPKDFFAKIERNRQIRNSINRAFADLHQSYIDGQIAKNSVVANAVKNLEAKYTPLSLKEREVQAKQRIAERNERIKEVDRLIEKEASGRADESSLDNWSNERRKAIAERDKAEGELQKIEHEKRSEAGIKSAITRAKNERRKLEEEIYRRELKHGKRIAKENAKRIAEAEEEERRRPAREARRKAMKDAMRKADIDEKRRAEEEARRKADEETESPSTQEETDTTQKEGVKDTPDISTEELEANPAFMRNNKIRQGNLKRFYPNRMEEYINPSSCEVIVLAGEKTDGTKVYHKLNSNGITINEVITEVPNGFGKHAIDNPNGGKVLRTVATTQDTASSAPESAKNFYTKKDNLPTIDFFDMSTKQVNYVQAYYSNDPELYLDKNNNAVSGGKNHKFSVIAPDGQEMEKGTASLSKYLPVKRVYRAVLTDVDSDVRETTIAKTNDKFLMSISQVKPTYGMGVETVVGDFVDYIDKVVDDNTEINDSIAIDVLRRIEKYVPSFNEAAKNASSSAEIESAVNSKIHNEVLAHNQRKDKVRYIKEEDYTEADRARMREVVKKDVNNLQLILPSNIKAKLDRVFNFLETTSESEFDAIRKTGIIPSLKSIEDEYSRNRDEAKKRSEWRRLGDEKAINALKEQREPEVVKSGDKTEKANDNTTTKKAKATKVAKGRKLGRVMVEKSTQPEKAEADNNSPNTDDKKSLDVKSELDAMSAKKKEYENRIAEIEDELRATSDLIDSLEENESANPKEIDALYNKYSDLNEEKKKLKYELIDSIIPTTIHLAAKINEGKPEN